MLIKFKIRDDLRLQYSAQKITVESVRRIHKQMLNGIFQSPIQSIRSHHILNQITPMLYCSHLRLRH